jgi:hypothetical protein
MNKNELGGWACVGVFVALFVAVVGGSIMNGWVLSTMWGWFAVPLFHLPTLTVAYAIGISLLIGMFSRYDTNSKDGEKKDTTKLIAELLTRVFVTPLATLFFGWIVKMFI